jgi:Cys-tRNA(Pro) deacylase
MKYNNMDTIVTRFLDSVGIDYRVKPHKEKVYTCGDAARERGVRLSQIIKCMVGKDIKKGVHVMMIPGDKLLKLKRVRQVAGGIGIDLIAPEDLSKEFNLTVGAISPIQFVDKAKFYMDNSVSREEIVDISSGEPDTGIELTTNDLKKVLNPIMCDIISVSNEAKMI